MARARLKPANHPYWRGVSQGFHVGYYRGKRAGRWVVRYRRPGSGIGYVSQVIGDADDITAADGEMVLSWGQALGRAVEWVKRQRESGGVAGDPKMTVGRALELYVAGRDDRDSKRAGRPVRSDASSRLNLHVLSDPELPYIKLAELTEGHLREWQRGLGELKGTSKRRLINDVKAALNAAYLDNRTSLPSDFPAMIKVGLKPVFAADPDEPVARVNQVLGDEQVRSIVRAAAEIDEDGDFGRLVLVLAATGARFSQISRMLVQDLQCEQARLLVPHSRKGQGQGYIRVPVDVGVIEALAPATESRDPQAPLLERWRVRQIGPASRERVERGPWKTASEMTRKWQKVRAALDLPSEVVPYALRHSSIVRALKRDLPIRLVAALHDTSVAMIERHYSRWIADRMDDLASGAIIPLA
jgi:integrase